MVSNNRPKQNSRLRGWWPLIVVGIVYAIAIAVTVAVRTSGVSAESDYTEVRANSTSDFRDFWWTARHYRETGEIRQDFGVHNYLPFFTVFMLPWSLLPLPVAAVLFSLLSLGLFAVTVVLVENLLSDEPAAGPRWPVIVALVLVIAYVHSCAVLGNVGLLLLFLVVTAWFLVERDREWEAGVALGLAILIKLLPAVLVVFFLLKRRWRVAGAAAGVVVVLGIGLPATALGIRETVAQHQQFYDGALRGHSAHHTLTADKPPKTLHKNNALPMVLRRLLSRVNCGSEDALYVNIVDWPPAARLGVYATLLGGMLVASVFVTMRRPQTWPPATIDAGRALRAQFGVWCCLMLLASPLVWTHYLPLAYWPLALLADHWDRFRRTEGRICRISSAALLVWLLGVVLLAWPTARAAGAQLASVAAVWVAVLLAGRQSARPPAALEPGKRDGAAGTRPG